MDYMGMAAQIAREEGIDPEIFLRQIAQESRFNPDAVSPRGAVGIAQIMPKTAKNPGYGIPPIEDRTDPEESLRFGARYMRAMLDEFDGDYGLALAAYNSGAQTVKNAGGIPDIPETQNYVSTILGGAASPSTGFSMGSPVGTLPSEEFMTGVSSDDEMGVLQDAIQSMMRGQATPEQYQTLQQVMEQNALSSSRLRSQGGQSERGVLSLPQARPVQTVMERMAAP